MKNTLENKAKFFTQYWGINCFVVKNNNTNSEHIYNVDWNCFYPKVIDKHLDNYLELKSISQISDEDAIALVKLFFPFSINTKFEVHKNSFNKVFVSWGNTRFEKILIDDLVKKYKGSRFLQKRGYAVEEITEDGETITIEELIEFGWIKFKK